MSDPVAVDSSIQGAPDPSQPPQAPPQAPPQQPAPDDQKTHGWRAVLQGALSALKGAGEGALLGGIPGAIAGGVNPKLTQERFNNARTAANQQVQQRAAQIQFTNAEAASQMADARMRDAQREQMPAQLQLKRDEMEQETAKMLINAGIMPRAVAENTTLGATTGAQQLQDANGGAVPQMVYLHVGDHHLAFNPDDMAGNAAVLDQVNTYQQVTGGPQFTSSGQLLKQPNKVQILQGAATLMSPTPIGGQKAEQQIQQYQGYINNVEAWPDDKPNKEKVLNGLKDAQKLLIQANSEATAKQEKLAAARGAAAQNAKAVSVIDPATNRVIYTDARTAKEQGLTPASEGTKLEAKAAQLEDMNVGSQNARKAITGLKTKISPATLVQIQAALKSNSEGYIENAKRNLLESGLSEDQAQYVTSILNLQERALSLRSIGGQGQGSETQRQQILRLLPGIADLDNKQLMKQKLDAFDQQVGIYFKNLPKVNVKGTAASPSGQQQQAPATASGSDFFSNFGGTKR